MYCVLSLSSIRSRVFNSEKITISKSQVCIPFLCCLIKSTFYSISALKRVASLLDAFLQYGVPSSKPQFFHKIIVRC
jgi:hypothetical protein